MQDVLWVNVANRQSQLTKPVENLLVGVVFAPLSILDLFLQITIFSKLCYNAKTMFLVHEALMVFYNIGVVQSL